MSRLARSAAVMALFVAAVPGSATPVFAADSSSVNGYALVGVICDELGPDTFVFAGSDLAAQPADRRSTVTVRWIDVQTTDSTTHRYVSHDRLVEPDPDGSVEEICSYDLPGDDVDLTITTAFALDAVG